MRVFRSLMPVWAFVASTAAFADTAAPVVAHESFTLPSSHPAEARHINVYKPPGYDACKGRYPVLYMPDGGLEEDFPHVAEAVDKAIRKGEIQPLVVVGIENTQRRRDMTGPTQVASDREIAPQVGGSADFRDFIAKELVPAVEKRYRVNAHRGIIGESLAGLFSVETFLRQPDLFETVIAISPSLWWNDGRLLGEAPALLANGKGRTRRIYLTSADEDRIPADAAALSAILGKQPSDGLKSTYVPRPKEHHDTIYLASQTDALRWAYGPAPKNGACDVTP
ncbi:hypothetical protein KCV01_g9594, partial [Aureobasidium melanogenum]